MFFTKRVKTVATMGPACNEQKIVENLVMQGATVFRLNFSHGDFDEHQNRVNLVNTLRKELNRPISLMLDTKGPEIRTHNFENNEVEIIKNSEIKVFLNEEKLGNSEEFSINYSNLGNEIKKQQKILVDDGKLQLVVKEINKDYLLCYAENTHKIKNRRAINVPGVHLNIDFLSEKDKADIIFGIQTLKVDYVAASFVNSLDDLKMMRNFLDDNGGNDIQIISKIETKTSLENIDDIIQNSDGVMVARGDLGVETPFEEVPLWEKRIIRKCNLYGKPVIVATQMLDSMTANPTPTRAEVSDVYWAVDLGTDATMLSAESANGNYPVEAVTTMTKIIRIAESNYWYLGHHRKIKNWYEQDKIVQNKSEWTEFAFKIAKQALDEKIHHIIIFDDSENMELTKKLSLSRAKATIIPVVNDNRQWTAFGINYGIYPELVKDKEDVINNNNFLIDLACKKYGAKKYGSQKYNIRNQDKVRNHDKILVIRSTEIEIINNG